MLYGLGKLWQTSRNSPPEYYGTVPVHACCQIHFCFYSDKYIISPDQSTLDDIEKTLNDDMKRIISWLQQLKYVHPFNFPHIIKNKLLWNRVQTQEFNLKNYKYSRGS